MLDVLFNAVWYIFPAWIANASAVVLGGGTPLDFGLKHSDNERFFGDGKTVRGFILAVLVGGIVGMLQGVVTGDPQAMMLLGLCLGFGAMLGDVTGSFVKRRMHVPRGAQAPFLDQLNLVVGALLMGAFAKYYLGIPFGLPTVEPLLTVAVIFVLTYVIHYASNFVAHRLGLKKVPW